MLSSPSDNCLLAAAELFAKSLAIAARPLAQKYFRTALDVVQKADTSPVTRADREIEQCLRDMIHQRFPSHGVLGEETGGDLSHQHTWVIDPIDGTKSFVCGHPLFGTLIALLEDGRPVLGMIDMPMLGECWLGNGRHSTLNDVPARASSCAELARARLFATSPDQFTDGSARAFNALRSKVRLCRFGGDCYSYGLLASGHCELVVETGLQPYDVMALVPVVEGAGGSITDWHGAPLRADFDGRVLAAANAALHAQALQLIQGNQ